MSAITIPDGFFPPPGVPFSTEAQRDVAVAMHNVSGDIALDFDINGIWISALPGKTIGKRLKPSQYRIAPPKPRTVGPFESNNECDRLANAAFTDVWQAAKQAGFKRFRIHLIATAEEIM